MQSSTSSLPSSPNMTVDTDPFSTSKRPLTDVKEEPLERDDDFEMVDSFRQEDEYKGRLEPLLGWRTRLRHALNGVG